jgi:hypothetical protein
MLQAVGRDTPQSACARPRARDLGCEPQRCDSQSRISLFVSSGSSSWIQ